MSGNYLLNHVLVNHLFYSIVLYPSTHLSTSQMIALRHLFRNRHKKVSLQSIYVRLKTRNNLPPFKRSFIAFDLHGIYYTYISLSPWQFYHIRLSQKSRESCEFGKQIFALTKYIERKVISDKSILFNEHWVLHHLPCCSIISRKTTNCVLTRNPNWALAYSYQVEIALARKTGIKKLHYWHSCYFIECK